MQFHHAVLLALAVLSAQYSVDSWARTLVPLLESVRSSIGPHITAAPGTLPPSPITGHSAALFAIRIGVDSVPVDEQVVKTIDRLLQWRKQPKPLSAEDQALIERWTDELRVKVVGRLAGRGLATAPCDDVCVGRHLTNPETLFDGSRREREEERDRVLLDALTTAVLKPGSDGSIR